MTVEEIKDEIQQIDDEIELLKKDPWSWAERLLQDLERTKAGLLALMEKQAA